MLVRYMLLEDTVLDNTSYAKDTIISIEFLEGPRLGVGVVFHCGQMKGLISTVKVGVLVHDKKVLAACS